jgi:hypothetical protein
MLASAGHDAQCASGKTVRLSALVFLQAGADSRVFYLNVTG